MGRYVALPHRCTAHPAPNHKQPAVAPILQTIGPGHALKLAYDAVVAYSLASQGAAAPWANQNGDYNVLFKVAGDSGPGEPGKLKKVRIGAAGIPLFEVEKDDGGEIVEVSHVRTAPPAMGEPGEAMPRHTPKPREYRGANLVLTKNLELLGCECSNMPVHDVFAC